MSSDDIGLMIVAAVLVAALPLVRWLHHRGPVPWPAGPKTIDKDIWIYIGVNYGTMALCLLLGSLLDLPVLRVLALGVGVVWLAQGLLRPSWSRAARDMPDAGTQAAAYVVFGTLAVLFGAVAR